MDIETWMIQLRKGVAELILLRILKKGEAYGYAIRQQLSQTKVLALGESTVYPLLNRQTQEGYLSVRIVPSPDGPSRRYYRLTPQGYNRLKIMETYWNTLTEAVKELNIDS